MSGRVADPLAEWVPQGARLLDLGCGNGEILQRLRSERQIEGFGVEIDSDCIQHCLASGLDVLQHDLNDHIDLFAARSFDLVLAKDVLHYAQSPYQVLDEMLRIGKQVVVGFDNYGWWRRRLRFMFGGRYQATGGCDTGESEWYQQQSFNLFSVTDFEQLCQTRGCTVLARRFYPAWPFTNLMSHRAWYLLQNG